MSNIIKNNNNNNIKRIKVLIIDNREEYCGRKRKEKGESPEEENIHLLMLILILILVNTTFLDHWASTNQKRRENERGEKKTF